MEQKIDHQIHKDQQYIEALLSGNKKAIEGIYANFYPAVESYITKNNGNVEDAKDLFSESLKIIFLQAKKGLKLHSSFKGFLITICKRRWINELKKRSKQVSQLPEHKELSIEETTIESIEQDERMLLYRKHFKALSTRCQEILTLSFEGLNLREIAEQLKLNYSFIRRRANECTKHLTKAIKSDPLYQEVK